MKELIEEYEKRIDFLQRNRSYQVLGHIDFIAEREVKVLQAVIHDLSALQGSKTKSKEEVLDKHLPCDAYPVWENNQIKEYLHEPNCRKCSVEKAIYMAMEEYASQNQENASLLKRIEVLEGERKLFHSKLSRIESSPYAADPILEDVCIKDIRGQVLELLALTQDHEK